jgi:membrane fusion protein, copper/silver efflux system
MTRAAVLLAFLLGCRQTPPDPHAGHGAAPAADEHAGHGAPGAVEVAPEVVRILDIRTAPAELGSADVEHRAPATVGWDPLEVFRVSAQPGGQVRELALPRVGETVRNGQVIARLYSPEIAAAFEELRVAQDLGEPWAKAARSRLVASGVSEAEVDAATKAGTAPPTYAVRAPQAGVVLQRLVAEGAWLSPGAALALIGDPEDLVVEMVVTGAAPAEGTTVRLRDTTRGDTWTAAVASSLPTAEAAGLQVRLVPDAPIPVGTPLVAEWTVPAGEGGVWVPSSALVDTGERRVVFVETAPGRFEPRPVRIGVTAGDRVQIVDGLATGEPVVISGTFLLDSETQMGAMGHAGHGG